MARIVIYYCLLYTSDAADESYFWVELDDGLTAEDTETSFTDEFVDTNLRVNMYRVRKLE